MFKNNLLTYTMDKNGKKQDWRKRLSIIYHKLIDNNIKVTWLDLIRKSTRQQYIKKYNRILRNEFYNIIKQSEQKIEPKIKQIKKELDILIISNVLADDITYKTDDISDSFISKIKNPILEWLKGKDLFIGDKIIYRSNLSKKFKNDKKIAVPKKKDAKDSVIGYTMHVLYELETLYYKLLAEGKKINKKLINLIIYYEPLQTEVQNVKKQHFKHNELLNCVLSAIAKQKKELVQQLLKDSINNILIVVSHLKISLKYVIEFVVI